LLMSLRVPKSRGKGVLTEVWKNKRANIHC
jgi:hypothetical protein